MDFFRGSLDHRLGVRNAVQKVLYVPRAKAEVISRSVGLAKWPLAITLPGFLIIAAVGAASGLIQISSARPSRPLRAQQRI